MTGQADLGGGPGEVEDYPDFEDNYDTTRAWLVATGGPSPKAGQVSLWTRPQSRAPFESGKRINLGKPQTYFKPLVTSFHN